MHPLIEYNHYVAKHALKQNKGHCTKDSEKTKTYSAEWKFFKEFDKIVEFNDLKEAQKFTQRICKSATWKKLHAEKKKLPREDIQVVLKKRNTGRGHSGEAYYGKVILDSHIGLNQYVLIHELSHCIGNWHHGRSFRRDLVRLVSRFIGAEAATILKRCFKENKLAYGEAKKPLSYEQWLAKKEHMKNIRNKKGQ